MKLNKCSFCYQITYTPVHVTEIRSDKSLDLMDLCTSCAAEYQESLAKLCSQKNPQSLTEVKSTSQLLTFISGMKIQPLTPCKCGWTERDFQKTGRMGCSACYDHFKEKAQSILFKYHGAKKHIGKIPTQKLQAKIMEDPRESLKTLKLQYARALELEEYEKMSDLNRQIIELEQRLLP